jgi:site-specific DNA-methyltransferase (adenine-specific)
MGGYMQTAKSVEWGTPQWRVDQLAEKLGVQFTFDPCCTHENAKAANYLTEEDDGLTSNWEGTVWFNPPYGRVLKDWMKKADEELKSGRVSLIVALLPARTDTRWFHDYVLDPGHEITFIKGRVKYGEGAAPAPFPSIYVVMRPENVR